MLRLDPAKRPSIKEILHSPFVKKHRILWKARQLKQHLKKPRLDLQNIYRKQVKSAGTSKRKLSNAKARPAKSRKTSPSRKKDLYQKKSFFLDCEHSHNGDTTKQRVKVFKPQTPQKDLDSHFLDPPRGTEGRVFYKKVSKKPLLKAKKIDGCKDLYVKGNRSKRYKSRVKSYKSRQKIGSSIRARSSRVGTKGKEKIDYMQLYRDKFRKKIEVEDHLFIEKKMMK